MAAETDVETGRISGLHTSCRVFAPFIFELQESSGFEELMALCNSVWSKDGDDDQVIQKLVSCCFNYIYQDKGNGFRLNFPPLG